MSRTGLLAYGKDVRRFQHFPSQQYRTAISEMITAEPTILLLIGCYAVWALATSVIAGLWQPAGIAVSAVVIAMYSSLQHEIIHGHPFANQRLNQMLVFPALNLFIPFLRFRDTHLEHHRDSRLTDPYDDPESNYLDPKVWHKLPTSLRHILLFNNTLFGRLLIGPSVAIVLFTASEWRACRSGNGQVLAGWLWHVPAVIVVIVWIQWFGQIDFWAYLLAVYAANSLLKIRTFLEHQAHEFSRCRTVIIEDRGFLAFLFLNNNLHVVHHLHPKVPWYALPGLYFANPDRYLKRNGGYRYASYKEVFSRYLWRRKDPLPHPLWPWN